MKPPTNEDELLKRAWSLALMLVGNPHDAEDLIQNACAIMLRKEIELSPDNWSFMAKTMSLEARNQWRRNRKHQSDSDPALVSFSGPGSHPDTQASKNEVSQLLWEELARLDEEEREAISMHIVGGMHRKAVAEISGVPEYTIKVRIQRGLRRLSDKLSLREPAIRESLFAIPALVPIPSALSQSFAKGGSQTALASSSGAATSWTLAAAALAMLSVGLVFFALTFENDESSSSLLGQGGSETVSSGPGAAFDATTIADETSPLLVDRGSSRSVREVTTDNSNGNNAAASGDDAKALEALKELHRKAGYEPHESLVVSPEFPYGIPQDTLDAMSPNFMKELRKVWPEPVEFVTATIEEHDQAVEFNGRPMTFRTIEVRVSGEDCHGFDARFFRYDDVESDSPWVTLDWTCRDKIGKRFLYTFDRLEGIGSLRLNDDFGHVVYKEHYSKSRQRRILRWYEEYGEAEVVHFPEIVHYVENDRIVAIRSGREWVEDTYFAWCSKEEHRKIRLAQRPQPQSREKPKRPRTPKNACADITIQDLPYPLPCEVADILRGPILAAIRKDHPRQIADLEVRPVYHWIDREIASSKVYHARGGFPHGPTISYFREPSGPSERLVSQCLFLNKGQRLWKYEYEPQDDIFSIRIYPDSSELHHTKYALVKGFVQGLRRFRVDQYENEKLIESAFYEDSKLLHTHSRFQGELPQYLDAWLKPIKELPIGESAPAAQDEAHALRDNR